MKDVFLEQLGIFPDIDPRCETSDTSLPLVSCEQVEHSNPSRIIVYRDTKSSMVAALAVAN